MKTITLKLAAGILVLGPLLAATIRDHKTAISAARQNQLEPPDMLELTCTLAQACAVRVNPGVTLADIENIVDLENFASVFSACWGVTLPEVEPGEAQQAVLANPST
jgi:hypothetical protein